LASRHPDGFIYQRANWSWCGLPLYAGTRARRECAVSRRDDEAGIIVAAALAGRLADRWSDSAAWTVLVLKLVATAVVIEARAVTTGRWAYLEVMPTNGSVRLSPLAQLALTESLAVVLSRPWPRRP
jgi:hypothetical protein